jgi:hypothetical protein
MQSTTGAQVALPDRGTYGHDPTKVGRGGEIWGKVSNAPRDSVQRDFGNTQLKERATYSTPAELLVVENVFHFLPQRRVVRSGCCAGHATIAMTRVCARYAVSAFARALPR